MRIRIILDIFRMFLPKWLDHWCKESSLPNVPTLLT